MLEQEVRVDAVWAAGLLRQHVVLRLSARGNKQKKLKKIFALRARPSSLGILRGAGGAARHRLCSLGAGLRAF